MNLLRTRPRPAEQSLAVAPSAAVDIDELAAAIDAAAERQDRPPVMLVSRRPPLLLMAIPHDAPSLSEILTSRAFSVQLGEQTASCHLHATADGGETALLVGDVVALAR